MSGKAPAVRLVEERVRPLRKGERERWASVATHTHVIRGSRRDHARIHEELVEWCARHRIDAAGLGSPWESVSAESYLRHEGPERDRYYAGLVEPSSVMDREAVARFFDDMNRAGRGRTLFYLDNETPKGPLGHLFAVGGRRDCLVCQRELGKRFFKMSDLHWSILRFKH